MSLSSTCVDSKKTQHFNVTFEQINWDVLPIALEDDLILLKHKMLNLVNLNKTSILTWKVSSRFCYRQKIQSTFSQARQISPGLTYFYLDTCLFPLPSKTTENPKNVL